MRHQQQHGFTLIELVVTMSIIGALLLVLLPVVNNVLGVDQRKASRELASTLRFLNDESVVRNAPMRLAYDLDHNTWWVEAADGPVRIFRDRKGKEAFDEFLAEKKESDEEVAERAASTRSTSTVTDLIGQLMPEGLSDDAAVGGAGLLSSLFGGGGGPDARGGEYRPNEFRPLGEDDSDFSKRELPSDVRFWGVWTPATDEIVKPMDPYEREAMEKEDPADQKWTVAYTHIFPAGYMEDTVLYLSDESGDDMTTIIVEPLTGRVRVIKGMEELPDISDREQR
jgi:prepilin-type N-terminal cleavage/methylation domain-containing protein